MAGSIWSTDGSGLKKNSSGGKDEMVMLYAMSSFLVQSLLDLADRVTLAMSKYLATEDVIRMYASLSCKTQRHLHE